MKRHTAAKEPRDKNEDDLLFGPGAARHVELQGAVAGTIYSRAHDVFLFLDYLKRKQIDLPTNANALKGFASFLATREYSNRGARISHVWTWLQTSPTPQRLWHTVDKTEWSALQYDAERREERLIGAKSGTIARECEAVNADCKRIDDGHCPTKTLPPFEPALEARVPSLSHYQQAFLAVQAGTGVRGHLLSAWLPGDLAWVNPPDEEEYLSIAVRADKVNNVMGRNIRLSCSCKDVPQETLFPWSTWQIAFCVICNPNIRRLALPIPENEVTRALAKMGLLSHCWRRAMALRFRAIMEEKPDYLDVDKVLKFLGWSKADRLIEYSIDLRNWDGHKLPHVEKGALKFLLNTSGRKQPKIAWMNIAATIGTKKVVLRGKPTRGVPGTVCSEGGPSHTTITKPILEPGAVKRSFVGLHGILAPSKDQPVVEAQEPAPPEPPPPELSEEDRAFEEMRRKIRQNFTSLQDAPVAVTAPHTSSAMSSSSAHAPPPKARPSPAKSEERLLPKEGEDDDVVPGHIVHGQLTAGTSAVYGPEKRSLEPPKEATRPRKKSKIRTETDHRDIEVDVSSASKPENNTKDLVRNALRRALYEQGFTIPNGWTAAVKVTRDDDTRDVSIKCTKCGKDTCCPVQLRQTWRRGDVKLRLIMRNDQHGDGTKADWPPVGDNRELGPTGGQKWPQARRNK